MKVISTNIAEETEINYRGKIVKTGIYKYPTNLGIYLEATDVRNDVVVDRRYHGGIDKACYLYSYEAYAFWKPLYADLKWDYGMFGENITLSGLDEKTITVGSRYKIGEAVIEIAQPRQPCYKQGIRMGTQAILKQFINTSFSGIYVRVIKNGLVKPNNSMELIFENETAPTIAEVFYCYYQPELKRSILDKIFNCDALPDHCKKEIQQRIS